MHTPYEFVVRMALVAGCMGAAERPPQPTSLSEALGEALERHPLIVAANQRVFAARGARTHARRLPNPTFLVSAENVPFGDNRDFLFSRDMEWFAIVSQRIETASKRSRRTSFADDGLAVAQADRAIVEREIAYRVKVAYQRALLTRDRARLLEASFGQLREFVALTQLRAGEGYVADGDAIKARLEAERFHYDVRRALLERDTATLDLSQAMGRSELELGFELAARFPASQTIRLDRERLRTTALARPELTLAEARVAQARALWNLEKANGAPDVTASVGYKRNGPDNTLYAGVTVPVAIFYRNQGLIEQARTGAAAMEAELELTRARVLGELDKALLGFASARTQVEALKDSFVKRADESHAIAVAAYEEGATDLLRVLEAERTRISAQELMLRALSDYRLALHAVERAAGLDELLGRERTVGSRDDDESQ